MLQESSSLHRKAQEMLNAFYHRVNGLSIRFKLLLVFILLLLVATGLFSIINLDVNYRATSEQTQYTARQALVQTRSFVENKCNAVIDILDIIAANDTIRQLISTPQTAYAGNLTSWWADASKLNTVLFNMLSNKDIQKYHLYFDGGLSRIADNADFTLLDEVKDSTWFKALSAGPSFYTWFAPGAIAQADSGSICAVRKMPSSESLRESICVIRADIPEGIFQSILNQGAFSQTATLLIVNSNNDVITASDNYSPEDHGIISAVLGSLSDDDMLNGVCRMTQYNGVSYLVGAQSVKRSDWNVLLYIPYKDVVALSSRTQSQIVLIFIILSVLTVPLAYWAAQSSTKRIRQLTASIRTVGSKFASTQAAPGDRDEIEELSVNYHEMLQRIDSLLDEKYSLGRANKHLELKALQAQINPHFLYNSLDLINVMGLKNNSPEIVLLVGALARFYKLSLSRGEDIVKVKSELELVKSYICIQNIRFDNCVSLEIDVPDEILDFLMPKIILQPLVENSVMHGILEKEEEKGIIRITGKIQDGKIILEINDDGVGMEEEFARNILSNARTSEMHGYGIRNIDERLKIMFGDEFGLTFESHPGIGTTVFVTMPAEK